MGSGGSRKKALRRQTLRTACVGKLMVVLDMALKRTSLVIGDIFSYCVFREAGWGEGKGDYVEGFLFLGR